MEQRFTEEQIIRVLKEPESGAMMSDLCRWQEVTSSPPVSVEAQIEAIDKVLA